MKIYHIAQDNYDKEIDDLMFSGWGVANQLDIADMRSRCVRKAWEVAFRIARAATREQRDIAIRELRDAAEKLLKELWRTGKITDPSVKEFADELRSVLDR